MTPTGAHRLVSLDAFRGLTVAAMILVNNPGSWSHVYAPLRHADWHGWTPTDLVFPFFLFIAGTAIPLAFAAQRTRGADDGLLALKALRRALVLVVLGWVLASPSKKGFAPLLAVLAVTLAAAWGAGRVRPRHAAELLLLLVWSALGVWLVAFGDPIRIPGVLQRIGVCYALASLAYLWLPHRLLPWLTAALLLGYWALLTLVPVPGHGPGLLDDKAHNLASYLDVALLDGHLWVTGERDPEGPLSTLGALATILFGLFAGQTVAAAGRDDTRRRDAVLALLLRGSVLVVVGHAWSWLLPVNKPLWTSSYAVLTAGQATCALALCVWWCDVRGHRRSAAPAVTYGLNAITVFVGSGLLARAMMTIEVAPGSSLKAWCMAQLLDLGLPQVDASLAYALLWISAWYLVLRLMQARGWIVKV